MILKFQPEDFKVKEVLDLKFDEKGNYIYFLLKKKNWTTMKALNELSKRTKCNDFGYAGLKDYAGITEQFVSCLRKYENMLKRVKIKDISIKILGYGIKQIGLGMLEGNDFDIIVRGLKKSADVPDEFVNYFGQQRFGGEFRANTHLVGKYLMKRDYEKAFFEYVLRDYETETKDHREFRRKLREKLDFKIIPRYLINEISVVRIFTETKDYKKAMLSLPKRLLTLFLQAYQAYLFNLYLKIKVADEVEVLGFDSKPDEIYTNLLKKEGIELKDFKTEFYNLHAGKREGIVKVTKLKVYPFKGSSQRFRFFLPKGSYATVFLEQVFEST